MMSFHRNRTLRQLVFMALLAELRHFLTTWHFVQFFLGLMPPDICFVDRSTESYHFQHDFFLVLKPCAILFTGDRCDPDL